MKYLLRIALFFTLLSGEYSYSQVTITMGVQNDISLGWSTYNSAANTNYQNTMQFAAYSLLGEYGGNKNRVIFNFNLSVIPAGSIITSAKLNLYAISYSSLNGHFGTSNSSFLKKVTASWNPLTVTWNNCPATSTENMVTLPQSTSNLQDYTNINITGIIKDIYENPGSGYGILLGLINEAYGNGLVFGSSHFATVSKRPVLEITYQPPYFKLEGYVKYANTLQTPLNNVRLILMKNGNIPVDTLFTNTSGYFSTNIDSDGDYTLVGNCPLPWGGVNSLDAMLTLREFLGLEDLTGIYKKACDLNMSSYINATDAMMNQVRQSGLSSGFPAGDWIFDNNSFTVTGPGETTLQVKTLCTGDVNGSYSF
ncbi:MAG: DNRLRE domain-containing protein [Bacteroidetes bacterium]|nr:DNRLRE domain-containing protein [Bacteroidota bacterium]